ncbi:MAG: hypothetical protein OEL76_18990 [Siculibacillus sp.]|nr:hypothetical protein [Siculibacillus sp.]
MTQDAPTSYVPCGVTARLRSSFSFGARHPRHFVGNFSDVLFTTANSPHGARSEILRIDSALSSKRNEFNRKTVVEGLDDGEYGVSSAALTIHQYN